MNIVAWNIQWGGGSRIHKILERLLVADPDVIVLGEYIRGITEPLLASLANAGWIHQALSDPPKNRGGVAVVSRLELETRSVPIAMGQSHYRYIPVRIPEASLELCAVYAPLQKDPYVEFWEALLDDLASISESSALMVGDLNSGLPLLDTPAKTVFCSRFFRQLPGRGYFDLWRRHNGERSTACTWQGPTNPYRFDHAFGTDPIAKRLKACSYDHSVREERMSDHSLLNVRIAAPERES